MDTLSFLPSAPTTARLLPAPRGDYDPVFQELRNLAAREHGSILHVLYAETVNGVWKHRCLNLKCSQGHWTLLVTWLHTPEPNFENLYRQLCIPGSARREIWDCDDIRERGVLVRWNETDAECVKATPTQPQILELTAAL